jgi:hypothetical protein
MITFDCTRSSAVSSADRTAHKTAPCTTQRPAPPSPPAAPSLPACRFSLLPEAVAEWASHSLPRGLESLQRPALSFIFAAAARTTHANQQERKQERDAPSPLAEGLLTQDRATGQDHAQRYKQPQRRRRLDERGVVPPLPVRRMLRDIRRRPPYSPPSASPCSSRSTSSRMGAAIPICPYVGSSPIAHGEPPMMSSVTRNACLRPTRSPDAPEDNRPKRPDHKPRRKRRQRRQRNAAVGWSCGKNDAEMMVASDPKM